MSPSPSLPLQEPNTQIKFFKRGTILQNKEEVHLKAFYIKKGLVRSYTIDSKGKQHIFMFALEEWIIGDIEAYQYNHPTELFIDCLEDTELIILKIDHLNGDQLSHDQLKKNLHLLGRRVGLLQRRVLMLMSATASERYALFLKDYPYLPNRIPQYMIASYLGITPEALSKIRSKKT